MGRWRRLGRLALDTSAAPWALTHAALPIVEALGDGTWSVYLSARDAEGRARIGRAPLTLNPSPRFGSLEPEPVLDLGALGAFDDSGVTGSSLVKANGRRYLYFTGWSRGVTVPFYLSAGVAVSEGSEQFRRVSAGPLLDRSAIDPFLTASPHVLLDDGVWRMWYVSGTNWSATPAGPRHAYHVRYAESSDGLTWRRDGHVCLDYASADEYAFARPCVVRDDDAYRMWYAVRGTSYRIGYAESGDGRAWQRLDEEGGLVPEGDGWEADMVEYPWVFDAHGSRYMLYNGNDYGKTGVGVAILERG